MSAADMTRTPPVIHGLPHRQAAVLVAACIASIGVGVFQMAAASKAEQARRDLALYVRLLEADSAALMHARWDVLDANRARAAVESDFARLQEKVDRGVMMDLAVAEAADRADFGEAPACTMTSPWGSRPIYSVCVKVLTP